MIPCIVIFLILQRYYVAGLTAVVGATGHIAPTWSRGWSAPDTSRLPCHRPPGCLVSGARASTGLGG